MNQRQIAKKKTKSKILEVAKHLFLTRGIAHTTTAHIAQQCAIAHGTVFSHFVNKDELICEVFITLLRTSAEELKTLYVKGTSFEELIGTFFKYIQKNESMFEIYFCELPGFSVEVKRSMHSFELALRNSFYYNLIEAGVEKDAVPVVLNLLFAQLLYYYSYKEILCGNRNVIDVFGPVIKKTLLHSIQRRT